MSALSYSDHERLAARYGLRAEATDAPTPDARHPSPVTRHPSPVTRHLWLWALGFGLWALAMTGHRQGKPDCLPHFASRHLSHQPPAHPAPASTPGCGGVVLSRKRIHSA